MGNRLSHDPDSPDRWAEQVDEWISKGRPEIPHPPLEPIHDTNEFFQHDQYDWENFKPDYVVIPLTKGYFTIVDTRDARRIMRYKWHANVQRHRETGKILKVYAYRNAPEGHGRKIYLHRLIVKAGAAVVIDHFNGLSLDNRRKNLRATTNGGNNTNGGSRWRRTTYHGLLRGVERRGNAFGGQIKCKGKTIRSKRRWNIPEPAHRWYLRKHKEVHGHRCVSEATREWPTFPPRKGDPHDVPF